jgi:hypothetical protein
VIKTALVALALALAPCASAQSGLVSGSLIDALAAIGKPELGGLFAYIGEENSPRAFADLIVKDQKALKKYSNKLKGDLKAAGGTTAWDHEACAALVTYYSTNAEHRPKTKVLKHINEAVLAPIKERSDIQAGRKK